MNDAVVRAAWAVPISGPPLAEAWLVIRHGRIVSLGQGRLPGGPATSLPVFELGDVAVMPGLVNAHTHLELSWLRGRVPPSTSMPSWVRALMWARAIGDDVAAIGPALDEAIACGTAAFGDIGNTLASVAALTARGVPAVVFHELIGFDPAVADDRFEAGRRRTQGCPGATDLRVRLAPHAPYSTSSALIRAIAGNAAGDGPPRTCIHVAESIEESRFLSDGTGPWADLLRDLGIPHDSSQATGLSPAAYLDGLGLWQPSVLAVHGVHLSAADLALLAVRGVTIVTCPRSNVWVGAGVPPVRAFAGAGIRVAIGTDSLASAPDLNVFGELQALHELAPDVPPRTLLAWATRNGADALGFEGELGTLDPGRRARLIAVRVDASETDVERRLVSGVLPRDVRWVEDLVA